jgi:hypothetical protein
MIQVRLLMTRVPRPDGVIEQHPMDVIAHIDPLRIDTVTELLGARAQQDHAPRETRSVIRYDDRCTGYRLMYVADSASDIARARRRELRGEDSDGPDYLDIEPA